MSDYRVKTGTDVALVSLTVLDPQPRSEGIKAKRRTYAASAKVRDEGRYLELLWSLVQDEDMYQDILNEFGVLTELTAAVTVYARDETFAYVRMNGIACRPMPGNEVKWSNSFPRDIMILVRNLTPAS